MTNEQVLAVYNLVQSERVKFVSITCYKTGPMISVTLKEGTELEGGTELLTEIFPDLVLTKIHNDGRYRNADGDIYLFM